MKIKTDFITNSSSTSFLLILDSEFSKQKFLNLIGISEGSPLIPIFIKLFDRLVEEMELLDGIDLESKIENLPKNVAEKLMKAKKGNKKIFTGTFSSDSSILDSYFCTDSFEAENEEIYFNYLENYW
jgi:hypothetical protein